MYSVSLSLVIGGNSYDVTNDVVFYQYDYGNNMRRNFAQTASYIRPNGRLEIVDPDGIFDPDAINPIDGITETGSLVAIMSTDNENYTYTCTTQVPTRTSISEDAHAIFQLVGDALGNLEEQFDIFEESISMQDLLAKVVTPNPNNYFPQGSDAQNVIFQGTRLQLINQVLAFTGVTLSIFPDGTFVTVPYDNDNETSVIDANITEIEVLRNPPRITGMREHTRDGVNASIVHLGESVPRAYRTPNILDSTLMTIFGDNADVTRDVDTYRVVLPDFRLGFEKLYIRINRMKPWFSNTEYTYTSGLQTQTFLNPSRNPLGTSAILLQLMNPAIDIPIGVYTEIPESSYTITDEYIDNGNRVSIIEVPIRAYRKFAGTPRVGFDIEIAASEKMVDRISTRSFGEDTPKQPLMVPQWYTPDNISLAEDILERRMEVDTWFNITLPLEQTEQSEVDKILQANTYFLLRLTNEAPRRVFVAHTSITQSGTTTPRFQHTFVTSNAITPMTFWSIETIGASEIGITTRVG